MQRFIPGGRHVTSLMVALSATLAACGGGSGDGTQLTNAATSSVGDSSTTTSSAADTASTPIGAAATDASVSDVDAKAIVTAGADIEAAPVALAVAESTVAPATATPQASAEAVQATDASSVAASLATNTALRDTTTRSGVGLNLTAINYYSSSVATFDVMKRGSSWLTQCNNGTEGCSGFATGAGTWDTKEEAALDLDAAGYPKALPAANDPVHKFRKVTTMLSVNGLLPAGRYTVVYDGAGSLAYGGNAVKQASLSKPGRDVVDLAAGSTASFWLTIAATTPGNHLRNIRVYMPGGACASDYTTYASDSKSCGGTKGAFVPFESFPAGKYWNPQFLEDVKGFRTLRFMDWGATNTTLMENWSERPLLTDRIWAGPNGVPVDAMIDLANTVGAEPWMNVPPHASDDYILQFARLATQKVTAGVKINLEYANEAWNYVFPATKWMLANAQAAWPEEVAKGTSIYALEANWYARRLVQTCHIAKTSSSGASTRFRCISNTQAAVPSATEQVLACAVAAKTLGQPCAKSIDVVSIAPYFGYYLGSTTMTSTLLGWATSTTSGLDKVFQELTGHDSSGSTVVAPLAIVNKQAPNGAIAQAASWMAGTKAVAAKYGLPMWAYEGGQHLVPPTNDANSKISNLMIAANRDPRMQAAYEQMIANWQSVGGQVFAYYSHATVPSKSGSWGLKESMSDNSNAKWKAALERRNSACWWAGC